FPLGKNQADGSPGKREQDAFREELPNDAPAAAPKREADCELLDPRTHARELNVGEIEAGDQQHEAHSAKEKQRVLAIEVTDREFGKAANVEVPALISIAIRRSLLLENSLHFSSGRGETHARMKQSDRMQETVFAHLALLRGESQWKPSFGGQREVEASKHHTDNGPEAAIHLDRVVENPGIGSESPSPEPVGEDHDAVLAWGLFLGNKGATDGRRCADNVKEIRGYVEALDFLWSGGAGQVDLIPRVSGESIKG